jgi:hypothetical protein
MGHIVLRVTAYMTAIETRVTVTSSMLGGMKAMKMLGMIYAFTHEDKEIHWTIRVIGVFDINHTQFETSRT